MLCLTGARADEPATLVATLSSGGNLTPYYGKDALKDAYNDAKEGDIITLSSGTFTSVAMNKNITIRGVGAWPDASTDNVLTCIDGTANYNLKDNDFELKVEGVRFLCRVVVESSLNVTKQCTFSKVYFSTQSYDYSLSIPEKVYAKLDNCVTVGHLSIYGGTCTNCVLSGVDSRRPNQGSTPVTLQNCVIRDWKNYQSNYNNISSYKEDVFTNCIFILGSPTSYDNQIIEASNVVHNCVAYNTSVNDINIFENITNSSNKMVADRDNFFKNADLVSKSTNEYNEVSGYSVKFDDLTKDGTGLYELSDEAKEIYKGNDNTTVVGVWGGATPFNMTPSNPRITKCEIVPKVDSEGKLKVTIEVAQ